MSHTVEQGIGRRLLQRQGWREGEGLGSRAKGIADALDGSEGQQSWDKKGLGYVTFVHLLRMHGGVGQEGSRVCGHFFSAAVRFRPFFKCN